MSAPATDKNTTALMKRMGSKTGRWNPLPPEHHLYPILHAGAIVLNQTERILLAYVQLKTVDHFKDENFPQGRTEQAHDSRGDLTLTHAAEDLDIDLSNLVKAAEVLESYGFIIRSRKGVLCMSAAGLNPEGRKESETANATSLYKPLPEYLDAHLKGLSENQRSEFLQGWAAAEEWQDDALAQAKTAIYERTAERKRALCKSVGIDLKGGGGRPRENSTGGERHKPQLVQLQFVLAPDSDQFVQTTRPKPVQTTSAGLHEPETEFVQNDASLFSSRVGEVERELARPAETGRSKSSSKPPAQTEAASEKPEDPRAKELDDEINYRIARSRLKTLAGKPLIQATVHNIRTHILRLPSTVEIKRVLETLEEKCRQLEKDPAEKNWGWLVGAVKGEVNQILEDAGVVKPGDLNAQLQEAVARKGMR